jgi:RHS repeat-associated protein
MVTEVIDADKKIKRTYTDNKGNVILERKYTTNGTTILTQTYYVYDDFDKLRAVVQPEGIARITAIPSTLDPLILANYCFQYNYDELGRLNAKKVPGGGWIQLAYDRWDRPAITQDEVQRAKNPQEFTYVKYDLLNRPIMSGTFTPVNRSLTIDAVRNELKTIGARYESRNPVSASYSDYTNVSTYPIPDATNSLEQLTQNYYDDNKYSDLGSLTFVPYLNYTAANVVTNVKGLVTGLKTKVLGTTNTWILTVNFYDQYEHIIQVQKQNINGVRSFATTTYDFSGRPLVSVEDNKLTASVGVLTQTTNTYDHVGRVLNISHQTNSQSPVLLANYKYTDLGTRIKEKNLHSINSGSSFLQSVDYTYNEKGWLTHINNSNLTNDGVYNDDANDLFGMDLNYYKDQQIDPTKALYNGNLSEQVWKSTYDNKKKGYLYAYDDLDRLTSASYRVNTTDWTSNAENNRFSLNSVSYDGNGNITGMQQNGSVTATTYGLIDNFSQYNYVGNQLMGLNDAIGATTYPYDLQNQTGSGNDYGYDVNGNLLFDLNKGVSGITYNVLNLPVQLTMSGGYKIVYTYDAQGNKLRKQLYSGTTITSTVDYWGSAQYLNGAVEFAFTPEGRTYNTSGTFKYEYFIKDQVGNVRLTFNASATGTAQVVQMDDYYPMGNTFNSFTPSNKNNYLFNGMEFQVENNLNTFDFHARMYNPQIGRSFQVDPRADLFPSLSPFSFLGNNPISSIDPTGMINGKLDDGNDGGGDSGGGNDSDSGTSGDDFNSNNDPFSNNDDWSNDNDFDYFDYDGYDGISKDRGGKEHNKVTVTPASQNCIIVTITPGGNGSSDNSLNNFLEESAAYRNGGLIMGVILESSAKMSVGPAVRSIELIERGSKFLGKVFGGLAAVEHGIKSLNAFKEGDYLKGTVNLFKAAIDIGITTVEFTNPLAIGSVLVYTILDMSGVLDFGTEKKEH